MLFGAWRSQIDALSDSEEILSLRRLTTMRSLRTDGRTTRLRQYTALYAKGRSNKPYDG